MEDDMDVNCGTILDGEETVQQCGQRVFDLMLKTVSGQPTKSESFDFGGDVRPCIGSELDANP
jgi:altronate hydrolase